MLLLAILVLGLFSGWIAYLVLGGSTRSAPWGTLLVVGLAGSLVGGLLGSLLFGDGLRIRFSGIIGSIVGAIIVLAVVQAVQANRARR